MKLFLLFIITLLIGCSNGSGDVYICTGPRSEAYHKTDHCFGLNRCSGDIERVTKAEAKDMGRHECGYCYGN